MSFATALALALVTSYGEPIPLPKLDGLSAQIVNLAARVARDRHASVPAPEARLCRAAQMLADALPQSGRPSNEMVESALRLSGIVEPVPGLVVARMDRGGDSELITELTAQFSRALTEGRYRHLGVALADAPHDKQNVIILFGESFIELAPLIRSMPNGGPARIEGRLLPPYAKPAVLVTPPEGAVAHLSVTPSARGFSAMFHCGAKRGRYQIEIVGEDKMGPSVLANFPVYCGMNAPVHLENRGSEGASGFSSLASAEAELLSLLNADRVRSGLGALPIDPKVSEIARQHSVDMATHNFVGHVSPSTGAAQDRVRAAKVDALMVLENVSRAYSVGETERGLMNSPGHRANILNRDVTHVGIGAALRTAGDARELVVTQLFVRRPSAIDPKNAPATLKARVESLRRPLRLTPLAEDAALTRVAAAAAASLARAPSDRQAAASGIESALGPDRQRFGTLRTVIVVASDVSQLDAHSAPSLTDGRSAFGGFGAALTTSPSGQRALALVVVLAEPR